MSGGGKALRTCGATPNSTAASAHGWDCPVAGESQRSERNYMMNNTNGWMSGWSGGRMWVWPVIGVAVVVLLVVIIMNQSKKK